MNRISQREKFQHDKEFALKKKLQLYQTYDKEPNIFH